MHFFFQCSSSATAAFFSLCPILVLVFAFIHATYFLTVSFCSAVPISTAWLGSHLLLRPHLDLLILASR